MSFGYPLGGGYFSTMSNGPIPGIDEEVELRFRNFYRCPGDLKYRTQHPPHEWEDEWDSMCNDRCSLCNAEIEPYKSEDIDD